ncbi:MAG: uncharacterized membrane protein YbaN (DUF454 family) [Candidatus Latescibacterota bacterium]|jgi:uncharacterized membrane protein YbaN (DUF454 family)
MARKDSDKMATGFRRILLMGVGTLSLVVGIVGIFLPILPTTCFLLLAAGCYSRSSDRFYLWLMSNRLFGRYLSDYTSGRGLPLGLKVASVGSLWLSIGYVVLFVLSMMWLQALLLILSFAITYHVLSLPSRKEPTQVVYGYGSGID